MYYVYSNFLSAMEITKIYVQVFKPYGNNMYLKSVKSKKYNLIRTHGLSKRKTNLHKWLYKIIILPFFEPEKLRFFSVTEPERDILRFTDTTITFRTSAQT